MLVTLALLSLQAPVAPAAEPPPRPLRWLDLDADGDLDALLLRADGALRFLRNDGKGTYTDATAEIGLDGISPAAALLTGDVDGDGRIDVILGGVAGLTLLRQEEGGAFLDVTAGSGLAEAGVVQALDWVDLEADGRPDLHVEGPEAHRVFRAEGPARFTRVEELELANGRAAVSTRRPLDEDVAPRASAGSGSGRQDGGAGLSPAYPAPAADARTSAVRPSRAPVASPPAAAGSPGAGTLGLPGCIKAMTDQATPGSCIQASTIPTLGLLHPLSADFNIDDATGRVGMGTTGPSAGLHLASNDGLLSEGSYPDGAQPIDGSGTRMVWNPRLAAFRAGFVSGSAWNADQIGDASAAFGQDTLASGRVSFAAGFNTQTCYAATAFGRHNVGGGGDDNWVETDPLFEVGNGPSNSNRSNAFTVLKNGNVGIDTATPQWPLHVRSASTGGTLIRAESTTTTAPVIAVHGTSVGDGGSGVLGEATTSSAGGISYAVRATASGDGTPIGVYSSAPTNGWAGFFLGRTYVDSLGVGTTVPDVQLHVLAGTDAEPTGGGYIQAGPTGDNNVVIDSNEIMAREDGGTSGLSLNADGGNVYISQNGTGRLGVRTQSPSFVLEVNGSAGKPGGGSWSSSSDRRLKKDIEDLQGALETLLDLRGVTFEYKDPEAINELAGTRIGFIAQEVEEVIPDWVDERADGMKAVTVRGFEALAVEALRELAGENRVLAERGELLERRAEELADENAELAERLAAVEAAVELLAAGRD